ncbi:MAG: hypothetical protein INR71_08395, partial [Terriglobus roseus]|nr:hypothetical protein [Terriglobus roseus]
MQGAHLAHLASRHSVRRRPPVSRGNCARPRLNLTRKTHSYVGTLHQINSESSTVALEDVQFMGTEGRMQDPDKEVPPNPQIFEYIVFKGG